LPQQFFTVEKLIATFVRFVVQNSSRQWYVGMLHCDDDYVADLAAEQVK